MCDALDLHSAGVKAELWQELLNFMQARYDKDDAGNNNSDNDDSDDDERDFRPLFSEACAQVAKALTKPGWVAVAGKLDLHTTFTKPELVENIFYALLFVDDEDPTDGGGDGGDEEDDVTKEASFFLLYAELSWPCDLKTLKGAWKRLAKETHPDNVTTENAHRFKILSEGFDALKETLEE